MLKIGISVALATVVAWLVLNGLAFKGRADVAKHERARLEQQAEQAERAAAAAASAH